MRSLFFLLAIFSVLGSVNYVEAQETESASADEIARQRYKEADANSDGSISRDEFKTYVELKLPGFKVFDKLMSGLDADNNDKISPEEFALRQEVAQKILADVEAEMKAKQKPKEFADVYNERFADNKPVVGDLIEKLTAFDEVGNKLDFDDLHGKYTVINFGCLT